MRLTGKVALVTGAGRGIGRAYAHALSAEGAKVVVCDAGRRVDGEGPNDPSIAEAVVAEIEAAGGEGTAVCADVGDFEECRDVVQMASSVFGGLDIVVNNAGIIRPALLHEADAADWYEVFAAHADATFNTTRHGSELMIRNGSGGTFINVGARSIDIYFPLSTAYRAAKAAIAIMTVHVATELQPFGINVNAIQPGATDTRMADAFAHRLSGDMLESFMASIRENQIIDGADKPPVPPDAVPPLGVFLCTDRARHVTGQLFQLFQHSISVEDADGRSGFHDNGDQPWTVATLEARFDEIFPHLRAGN